MDKQEENFENILEGLIKEFSEKYSKNNPGIMDELDKMLAMQGMASTLALYNQINEKIPKKN